MDLTQAKLNTDCVIKKINFEDETTKLRLMELGLVENTKIKVIKKSFQKRTLLIVFNSACFTIKDNVAKTIVVNYA